MFGLPIIPLTLSDPRPVLTVDIPELEIYKRGSIHDIYTLPDNQLLLIVTDRVSVSGHTVAGLSYKGKVLNGLSRFWYERTGQIMKNHLIATAVDDCRLPLGPRSVLKGRSLIIKKTSNLKVYFKVVRFPALTCVPQIKNEAREKVALTYAELVGYLTGWLVRHRRDGWTGATLGAHLTQKSLELFEYVGEEASERGLLMVEATMRYGFHGQELVLNNEFFNPDAALFTRVGEWSEDRPKEGLDEWEIKEYLKMIGWNGREPIPEISREILDRTVERFEELYRLLTGDSIVIETR